MIGLRGTDAANYAGKECDVVLGLGCRFSERTVVGIGDCKVIHVNLDNGVLAGDRWLPSHLHIPGSLKK